MVNKIKFITGETYTLANLFSGDKRIIIPDLQRDYCWGDEYNTKGTDEKGELVTDFVNNLLDQFKEYENNKESGSLNLGLFYGYEVPAEHIQLCDGQQRLTTLYLLLGMINKYIGNFRKSLISDFEYEHDDKEPYMNYAIRESSLYFLSDLVCKFFINNNDNVDKIKSADWYFDDYNLDPSIQSILKALAKIEQIVEENQSLDLSKFGDWLLNKVTFLYFDMENRKNGEETFVVINTTGEPLSSTQNLKPLIIQEKKNISFTINAGEEYKSVDKCWEEIETWFWKNREGDNDTADAGFAEFLRWVSIIEQVDYDAPKEEITDSIKKLIQLILQGVHYKFPYKEIEFKTIYNYWKALRWIAQNNDLSFVKNYLSPSVNKDVNNRKAIGQNDCFVLLPVLKYVFKNIDDIESNQDKQRNVKRIYEFFKNLIRIDNVSKAVNILVADAIKIIDLLNNGDLVSLLDASVDTSAISRQILTDEEKKKLEIIKNSADRNVVEEAFWSAQRHKIWSGEILPMIEWATDNDGFKINQFNKYRNKFTEIFEGKCDSNIDNVRRALLTRDLKNYPRVFRGYTNYSFGWDWSDWHVLINDNKDKFKSFFDDLLQGSDLRIMISNYISNSNNRTDSFYLFVLHPELLQYCEQKNIQKWDNSYCLVPRYRATKYLEMKTFCLYLDLSIISSVVTNKPIALHKDDGVSYHGWKMWLWQEGTSALVLDRNWNNLQVAIDVRYRRTKDDDWNVQLFLRKGDTQGILNQIASQCGLIWNESKYELNDLSRQGAIDKINDILKKIE